MVHQSITLSFIADLTNHSEPWIINFSASDRRTGNRHLFSSYKPSYGDRFIMLADGSSSKVVDVGSVNLSPYLSLSNVLHVSGLSYNLLFISKLTAE